MITKIVADIPLNIPGEKNPIHATLTLDAILESPEILDALRANNLLAMELNMKYIKTEANRGLGEN